MGLRANPAHPQRVSGSARTDSRRGESACNPIASHVNFGAEYIHAHPGDGGLYHGWTIVETSGGAFRLAIVKFKAQRRVIVVLFNYLPKFSLK